MPVRLTTPTVPTVRLHNNGRATIGAVRGRAGRDGSNVLPTDTAIAQAVADTASATRGALDAAYVPDAQVGAPSGVAPLDADGLLPDANVPDRLTPDGLNTAGDARWIQTSKRPVSLRDAAGIDWTGATDSAAAVQAFLTAAGNGSLVEVDARTGIIRCDSSIKPLLFQRIAGSAQKQGAGPTGATFDFSHMSTTGIAFDLSAGSGEISDVHIAGPGSSNTGARGFYSDGTGAASVTMQRCSAQRFGDGYSFTGLFYTSLSDCEAIYNRAALRLSGCYNVNVLRPKFYCTGTDAVKGTGIFTGTSRGLNVFGGSIEGYGGPVGSVNGGIVLDNGAMVTIRGTYFESPGGTGNAASINANASTGFLLNVSGCQVYLPDHRAFVDAESSATGMINSGGNKFECTSSTTPATPVAAYLMGSSATLYANLGVAETDSFTGVTLAVPYATSQGTPRAGWASKVPPSVGTGSGQGYVYDASKRVCQPSTTAAASLQVPHGVAPTTPANGDVWTTTAGMFVRINGVTKTVTLT